MKLEDIERLKSICEENGFEIKSESQSGLLYYIDKKDPWEGVEYGRNTETGQYFKVSDYNWGLQNCEPITEKEYIDYQSKNIKIDFLKWEWSANRHEFRLIFSYNKEFDTTQKLVIGNEVSKQIEKYLNEKPESIRCKGCYKLSSLLLNGMCQECLKNNQTLL